MNRIGLIVAPTVCIGFLAASFAADACPPGSILQKGNGWEGCVDLPGSSGPLWADRWGAIATDQSRRAFGSSSAEISKRKAEKYALSMCRRNGGENCAIAVSYFNQCISYVAGANWPFFRTDRSIEAAESINFERCQRQDADCKVVYSACSLQERIQ